ncbi:MAG TPA: ACT domain-containing protein, partial [Anaeromyxobacteraceae bacterium]|nr:ACT domain-containing protein [Anaeromyxobacteraceae bacterium]
MLAVLVLQCPDRPGIVAAISGFLFQHGANITDLDQHSGEDESGVYFMRLEFQADRLDVGLEELGRRFGAQVAARFGMEWRLTSLATRPRVAILASRHDHALLELLWQWRRGDLHAEVTQVISNHPDLGPAVTGLGVPFACVPTSGETRAEAEAAMLARLQG